MAKSFDIAMFGPSDGFTPIQMQKLNQNFQRVLEVASGRDENSEATVRVANAVQASLMPVIMDAAYPVGSLVFAKDPADLPRWGSWREVSEHDGRFVRIAGSYGSKGGSPSASIDAALARHRHTYYRQVAGATVKVDVSTSSSAKTVLSSIVDDEASSYTNYQGSDDQQSVSVIPPYVTMRLFERYE